MECSTCGHELTSGYAKIIEIRPDEKLHEDDKRRIDCDIILKVYYCPVCEFIWRIKTESKTLDDRKRKSFLPSGVISKRGWEEKKDDKHLIGK
ncbi:MAG: hypothetical protein BA867_09655 [Desulfobacterales bacterium S5133MH16]|nr:MAG: hypothetical protein BA867_09655 [Desulfobacterales bacterium S5133MH16]